MCPRSSPPAWRDRALAHLRRHIAREFTERNKPGYGRVTAPDPSRLVEILLSEQEVEAAWQEAGTGACRSELRQAPAAASCGSGWPICARRAADMLTFDERFAKRAGRLSLKPPWVVPV